MEGISSKAGGHPFPLPPEGQAGNEGGMEGRIKNPPQTILHGSSNAAILGCRNPNPCRNECPMLTCGDDGIVIEIQFFIREVPS